MFRDEEIRDAHIYKAPFNISVKGFKYFILSLLMEVTEYYDEERRFDTSVPSVLGLTEGFSLPKRMFYHVTNYSFLFFLLCSDSFTCNLDIYTQI